MTTSSFEFKRQIIGLYDKTSSSYDELYADEQKAKYEVALSVLEDGDVTDRVVLDAGCGTGLLLPFLAERFGDFYYVGVDFSRRMLEVARKRAHLSSCDLILADIDLLPLRDRSVRTTFCYTVVQNLPDVGSSVAELLRVTRGKVLISILKTSGISWELGGLIIRTEGALRDHLVVLNSEC